MYSHLDLFSGIGGFSLAAQMVGGINTIQFVEIDPHCQQVLAKNYPGVPIHDDIKTFQSRPGAYDLITAGFPCQPHSLAGKRKASEDPRDLWGALYTTIRRVQPRWVVLENVPGLLSSESGAFFKQILWQLTQAGYDAEWDVISCSALGGVHRRERLWLIATHTESLRRNTFRDKDLQARSDITPKCSSDEVRQSDRAYITRVHRGDDGLSSGLHQPYLLSPTDLPLWLPYATDGIRNHPERNSRMKALGNSIVPHVAVTVLNRIFQ